MNNIVMIKVEQLEHHPENPRKDLGDLTELVESIKANGIMQNLTVVKNPFVPDMYTVVIGNRRMEAAKAAGLEAVPCVISDMGPREQIATMLEENMQRADLTVYEQAQGFQMMMDLGYSAQEISEKTGFSETTVGRRLKMAQLDKETFRAAVGKQITIEALDQLAKIEDIGKRNELLANYGGNNFDWQVNRAIEQQHAKKVRPAALKMIEEHEPKLKQIPKEERNKLYYGSWKKLYNQSLDMGRWDGKKKFIPKTDEQLYWIEDGTDIEFYIKEKKERKEAEKKTPEQIEREKKIENAWKIADRVTEASAESRCEYATGLKVTPKNAMEMLQWVLVTAMSDIIDHNYNRYGMVKEAFDLKGMYRWELVDDLKEKILKMKQSEWPTLILTLFEGIPKEKKEYESFACGNRKEMPQHQRNTRLEQCYEWLTQFGYQMSDEEIRMMSGQHECFGKDGAAE